MATISELKWVALTAAINEMKSPNQFLKRLLFRNSDPKPTEDIELGVLNKGREIAPFVRKNGGGIMVAGYSDKFQSVQAPNIRIKRPFTPSELLYRRQVGTPIFTPGAAAQATAVRQHISRDLQVMADLITNSEEYLCALAIRGTIIYLTDDEEVFQITYPKPSGNNVTLSTFWDDADPTLPDPQIDFLTAKRLFSDEVGLGITDAIMGQEAAVEFIKLAKRQGFLDHIGVDAGNMTLVQDFTEDGVIYLGRVGGIRCWEYSRTVSVGGVDTALVRSKYVEFVTTSPAAEMVRYYGAIPDFKAMQGRKWVGERFSKSWETDDPSALMALAHSRPLPALRRPGAVVSMKVISG